MFLSEIKLFILKMKMNQIQHVLTTVAFWVFPRSVRGGGVVGSLGHDRKANNFSFSPLLLVLCSLVLRIHRKLKPQQKGHITVDI